MPTVTTTASAPLNNATVSLPRGFSTGPSPPSPTCMPSLRKRPVKMQGRNVWSVFGSRRFSLVPPGSRRPGKRSAGSCPRRRALRSHCGFRRFGVHPHHLPDVTVGILETAAVHEAEILLRAGIENAAGGFGLADHIVHGASALGGDADQDLAGGFCV